MVWLMIPCKLLHKDKLRDHKRSQCHADAVPAEAIAAAAAKRSGGIAAYLYRRVGVYRETSSTRSI